MARATTAKKERPVGVNPKNVQAFDRLAFLHQASILMSTVRYEQKEKEQTKHKAVLKWKGDPAGTVLGPARYFNNNMKQITSRLVMRLDPSVKRFVCKRCETPLLPAITSSTRVKSKPVVTAVTTCNICKAKKTYASHNKDYSLFSNRPDVVVEQNK
ncbi:uncharacterized protein EV154DRAFT_189195 [Mucor mucedo]|uniref:uncharacterized protein n=1 Tax=Mucor mucedo TaxID=29922 RepID=UPI00221F4BC7|nr:uncharacterized protein EV154DRAFT_189195 [Mucor mucedo]KAI7892499.1 hypothetical protein EV154DRAFT_189195 [Mucor mucedo]